MQILLITLIRTKKLKIKMNQWKSSMMMITKIKVSNTTVKPHQTRITTTTMITRQILLHRIISKMQQPIIMILKKNLPLIILETIMGKKILIKILTLKNKILELSQVSLIIINRVPMKRMKIPIKMIQIFNQQIIEEGMVYQIIFLAKHLTKTYKILGNMMLIMW